MSRQLLCSTHFLTNYWGTLTSETLLRVPRKPGVSLETITTATVRPSKSGLISRNVTHPAAGRTPPRHTSVQTTHPSVVSAPRRSKITLACLAGLEVEIKAGLVLRWCWVLDYDPWVIVSPLTTIPLSLQSWDTAAVQDNVLSIQQRAQ